MSDEYPGVKRLIVHFTDPGEIDFDWPFVALEREIASIEVDGEEWVPKERIEKLADTNGYLCAEVNRLQKLVEERTCCIEGRYYDELMDECYTQLSCDHETREYEPNYCPTCRARVVGRDGE